MFGLYDERPHAIVVHFYVISQDIRVGSMWPLKADAVFSVFTEHKLVQLPRLHILLHKDNVNLWFGSVVSLQTSS